MAIIFRVRQHLYRISGRHEFTVIYVSYLRESETFTNDLGWLKTSILPNLEIWTHSSG